MTSVRGAVGAALIALATIGLIAVPGCPLGDCWAHTRVTVTIDPSITVQNGETLVIVQIPRIGEVDPSGTDPQGLPIMASPPTASATRLVDVGVTSYQYADDLAAPYPTWFYAFIDRDGDGVLGSGEPYGTAPSNPYDLACKDYSVAVHIDRVHP